MAGEGGGEGSRGAAYHICQVHNRLGEVAGEDHRLPHLLELPREVGKKVRLPWASPPRVPLSLGTYQLVVVDNNQLYILGLAVHRGVAPADLEGGWALGISPLHVWADLSGGGILVSSQGQCQLLTGRKYHPSQPGNEGRGHTVSEGPPNGDLCRHHC